MTNKKLDIFEVLRKIDECDISYFENVTDDDLKTIAPLILMRWMSGTKDIKQVQRLNSIPNMFVFPLQKEKRLLIKLLMASSTSKKTYRWYAKKSAITTSKTYVDIIEEAYNCSRREALDIVKMFNKTDIEQLALDLGYQKEEISKIK